MQTKYVSATQLAKKANVSPQTVLNIAKKMGFGKAGPFKNSPLMLDEVQGMTIHTEILQQRAGEAAARLHNLRAERFKEALMLSRLASLAEVMGHPAHRELRNLQNFLNTIPKPPEASASRDIRSQYFARLCRSEEKLGSLINAVAAKI